MKPIEKILEQLPDCLVITEDKVYAVKDGDVIVSHVTPTPSQNLGTINDPK